MRCTTSRKIYGVLKGRALGGDNRRNRETPRFHMRLSVDDVIHSIAFMVRSDIRSSSAFYFMDENFDHPTLKNMGKLDFGFHPLETKRNQMTSNTVRLNLFPTIQMKPLPSNPFGSEKRLEEIMEKYVSIAVSMESSEVYVLGEKWETKQDKNWAGVDCVANQGISEKGQTFERFPPQGGLIIHLPDEKKWVAFFLTFRPQKLPTEAGFRVSSS